MKFFKGKCGTVVTKLFETECEGGPLEELIPNTTDAAGEKHVPVISVNGQEVTVKVGEVAHPMMDAHYITSLRLRLTKAPLSDSLSPGRIPLPYSRSALTRRSSQRMNTATSTVFGRLKLN